MKTIALLGNPNVGKTSLFNELTGSNQYVGNWAGVTVEKKEGYFDDFKIVDLPGIYAMDTFSNEEKVSKSFLQNEAVDLIINIVDASNLNRNLYLTTQLKQFNKPILIAINMVDIANNKGIIIDYKKLEEIFNVKIIPISAAKNIGIVELKEVLKNTNFEIPNDSERFKFKNDEQAYSFIEVALSECLIHPNENKTSFSQKIDRLLLNPFFAYPIFLLILWFIFQFTFSWVGQPLSNLLNYALRDILIPFAKDLLSNSSSWFSSLIIDGIISGVGGILVLLPVILALFICIAFLEDSGYMSRIAFLMDKLMRKIGLSGKAFIPMIIGFGCTVPAIMNARTLESEKDRKLTALLVPLMSCNARLPVYAIFAAAFFSKHQGLVVASLYLLGVILAFLIGLLFKNTLFKKTEEPFILELPEYKMPKIKSVYKLALDKCIDFLQKAGTIIFAMSVVIWFLSNFNFSGLVDNVNSSLLASFGTIIAPIFTPLGFGNWQAAVSLLTGLLSKEVIISSMQVIYTGDLQLALNANFTPVSAYAFLTFVLLYTPCISVIGVMKKEYGTKMTLFSITYQLVLAWTVSFIVYNLGNLIF